MLQRFGYQWTFRACALLPLLFCVILYSNHLWKKHNKEEINEGGDEVSSNKTMVVPTAPPKVKSFNINELIDKELWNLKYIVLVIGVAIFLFGALIPFIFLVSLTL